MKQVPPSLGIKILARNESERAVLLDNTQKVNLDLDLDQGVIHIKLAHETDQEAAVGQLLEKGHSMTIESPGQRISLITDRIREKHIQVVL